MENTKHNKSYYLEKTMTARITALAIKSKRTDSDFMRIELEKMLDRLESESK